MPGCRVVPQSRRDITDEITGPAVGKDILFGVQFDQDELADLQSFLSDPLGQLTCILRLPAEEAAWDGLEDTSEHAGQLASRAHPHPIFDITPPPADCSPDISCQVVVRKNRRCFVEISCSGSVSAE